MAKGRKLTFTEVRDYFEQQGCELLENEYINNSHPLRYVCSCGNESVTNWQRFSKGSRCVDCGRKKSSWQKSRGRHSQEYVEELFKERGCVLLDTYVNNYTPMRYRCSCGNESTIRLFCLTKGQKCRACCPGKGESHYNWIPDREEAALRKNLRKRYKWLVKSVLLATGESKKFKSEEIVGYGPDDLKEHLSQFPDWDNIRKGKWHIDHIFPIKAFLDHGVSDPKIINCLDNLQPLPAKTNLSKNAKYSEEDFTEWLSQIATATR